MVKRKSKPQYRGSSKVTLLEPGATKSKRPYLQSNLATTKYRSTFPVKDENLEQMKSDADFSVAIGVGQQAFDSDTLVGKIGNIDLHLAAGSHDDVAWQQDDQHVLCHLFVGSVSFLYREWMHREKNCCDCDPTQVDDDYRLHTRHFLLQEKPDHELWRAFADRASPFRLIRQLSCGRIGVWLRRAALVVPERPGQNTVRSRIHISACRVMQHLYGWPADDHSQRIRPNVEEFFSSIGKIRGCNNIANDGTEYGGHTVTCQLETGFGKHDEDPESADFNVQHPDLLPRLRLYQQRAVRWMIGREKIPESVDNDIHPLYVPVTLEGIDCVYFNRFGGTFCSKKPIRLPATRGGILADEMGLGKTVEVLACILCHPRDPTELSESTDRWLDGVDLLLADCNGNQPDTYCTPMNFDESNGEIPLITNGYAEQGENEMTIQGENEKLIHGENEMSVEFDGLVEANGETSFSSTGNARPETESIFTIMESEDDIDEVTRFAANGATPILETDETLPVVDVEGNSNSASSIVFTDKRKVSQSTFRRNRNQNPYENGGSSSLTEDDSFQCICGDSLMSDDDQTVQCGKCRLKQHARCVAYSRDSTCRHYFCPHCWVTLPLYPSRATVIVTPSTIARQWVEEMARHLRTNALRVLVYAGVREMGFTHPPTLADHDVVLVDYNTLRSELHFVDVPHCRSEQAYRLRRPKRFVALPSPLTVVGWYRVCLDEAQMVEGSLTLQARMVLRLPALNRWCVTGTPIQKSMDDLYGLLLFLGCDPYDTKQWWTTCLLQPYLHGDKEQMHNVLSKIMWRTSKKDVIDQIGIPHQTEAVHWLSFSPVEEHFYREQHIECANLVELGALRVSDLDADLNSVDRSALNRLMNPLLRIRQACCHPQVVRGQFLALKKQTLTMEKLLESLVAKTTLKCEDAHRIAVSSLNGLAAIHIIQESWAAAVDSYREVLLSVAELRPILKTDTLQQLHALHNLAEVLEAGHPNIEPALGDSNLRNDAKKLRDKYLSKCLNKVVDGRTTLKAVVEEIDDLKTNLESRIPWWSRLLGWVRKSAHHEEVIARIKADLSSTANDTMSPKFHNGFGLEYLLSTQLERLEEAHHVVATAINELEDEPSAVTVQSAASCHLRPSTRAASRCVYCCVDDLFAAYESKLFSMEGAERFAALPADDENDATVSLLEPLRRGTWADGDTERALKSLLACGRRLNVELELTEDGAAHLKLFETFKREFRALRAAWVCLRDQASAFDELGMATHRLRLRLPDEPRSDPPQLDVLEAWDLLGQRTRLTTDKTVAKCELQKRLGQLSYLKSLARSDYAKRGGTNPDPCPICQLTLGQQWSVLQCGHCFCVGCLRVLIGNGTFRSSSIKCAICRQTTAHGEISYCNTGSEEPDIHDVSVMGSHSTKVEAIVRQLLRIKRDDKKAKTLVFSTWTDVLEIIERALVENGLRVYSIFGSHKFQDNLNKFREDPGADALLLSISSGAKGLNITEATHVILVEPTLNTGSELQAIGRVHRIGQTKPTFVHRFFVRGSIEERIHALMRSQSANYFTNENEERLTPRHLLSLFSSTEVGQN